MLVWIVVALAIAWLGVVLAARSRRYRLLLADAHFLELGGAMARVKAATLANVMHSEADGPASAEDPRIVTTSAGLAVVYTISSRSPSDFVHHCSVSVIGGRTAHAVGGTFVIFVAKLVGLPIDKMRFEVGNTTVHHGQVSLDPAQHAELAATAVWEVAPDAVAELRRSCFEARSSVFWHRTAATPD